MKNLLHDQVAVITGGNAGIGKAIGLKFAEDGARVILWGTNSASGALAVEEIRQKVAHANVAFFQVDVSNTAQVNNAMAHILEKEQRVDILVNNAGITSDQLLIKMKEEDWDRVIGINLKSCYTTCHALVRSMMKARKGKIINISSIVGLIGNIGQANYAASKAGMIGLTKALAKELAGRNILVNCIAPGFIETKMTENLHEQQKEAMLKNIPLGRMGNASEIADAAWFLASSLSNYITGQVLTVDGGMVM
jgi:3-oxoacyl-[acyl-carrier protein] reductase